MSTLEISVERSAAAGLYEVQIIRSPAGEASATVAIDCAQMLQQRDQWQQALLASSAGTRRMVAGPETAIRAVGQGLFDILLGDPVLAARYRSSADAAARRGEPLRLVLRLSAPELTPLPWEAMYDPQADAYVSRVEPLVRHVPVASAPRPLRVQHPMRVLGITASPAGLPALDVEAEERYLARALEEPIARGRIELHWARNATWEMIQDLLLGQQWHIVHFIGHGDFDLQADEGVLALVGTDGRVHRVEASRFADLLHEASPMPRLVVLNSCLSALSGTVDLFSGTASALVRGGVSAVVAMQFEITDPAAAAFARGFYTAIAAARPVDQAVRSGRVAILGLSGRTLEWITPVLYVRGADTRLFTLPRTTPAAATGSTRARTTPAPAEVTPPPGHGSHTAPGPTSTTDTAGVAHTGATASTGGPATTADDIAHPGSVHGRSEASVSPESPRAAAATPATTAPDTAPASATGTATGTARTPDGPTDATDTTGSDSGPTPTPPPAGPQRTEPQRPGPARRPILIAAAVAVMLTLIVVLAGIARQGPTSPAPGPTAASSSPSPSPSPPPSPDGGRAPDQPPPQPPPGAPDPGQPPGDQPTTITVPPPETYLGQDPERVRQDLLNLGFTDVVTQPSVSTEAVNTVVAVSPTGEQLPTTPITVFYSSGTVDVVSAEYEGRLLGAVRPELEAKGLSVAVNPVFAPDTDLVTGLSPTGAVPVGSTVTVTTAPGDNGTGDPADSTIEQT